MDLDLFNLRRPPTQLTAAVVGEVTEADLILARSAPKGSTATPLKQLRERHHSLARLLASGIKPGDAGIMVGMSGSRVSILQADPTFAELVEFYRQDVDALYLDLHEQLAGMSLDAAHELRRRLEDDPEALGSKILLDMLQLGADRTGHGPKSTQVNVNVNIAERLQAARKRTLELQANKDGE